jgi:hypothetical protein
MEVIPCLSNCTRCQASSFSPLWGLQISFYMTLNKSLKSWPIWWMWDCKFRYLIVVCVISLIVRVSVNKSGGGLAWSRPFMSIYCSAEVECVCVCVCVELNLHSSACLHGTYRNNFTDTKLQWKHWIRFLSEEWLLHTYCWVQLESAIPGHKWQCFFFLELVDWLLQGRSTWSPSFSSQSLSLLWLLGLSQRREKFAPFSCLFSGGSLHCFWCTWMQLSVCIAKTQSVSCVLFIFCIMSLNFQW